jgi:hypothetical protein
MPCRPGALLTLLAPLLTLAGCSDDPTTPRVGASTAPASQAGPPPALSHDFGIVPHGQSRTFDYVFPLDHLRPADRRWVPLRAHLDCSCGRTQVLLRAADGSERQPDGRPDPDNAVAAGEQLVVRVWLDTITKDAVDLAHTTSRGHLILQPVGDRDGSGRVQWPFLVLFGIDAPVELRPFAALEFGRVPRSGRPELVTRLRGDANHPGVRFGPVRSSSGDLQASLEADGDDTVLRVRCTPSDASGDGFGNFAAVVQVDTSLPGYQVNLGAKWKVVPDLEASPLAKLSFRADLRREQTASEAAGQFLLVIDHDPQRTPEFVVQSLVDGRGQDHRQHFAVRLEPVPGSHRQQRLYVRSLGGLTGDFRGQLVLGKPGGQGPTLPIELVAFHRP